VRECERGRTPRAMRRSANRWLANMISPARGAQGGGERASKCSLDPEFALASLSSSCMVDVGHLYISQLIKLMSGTEIPYRRI
jgi:hypothetical protein